MTAERTPPGLSLACRTNAPAPSPNKIQVLRSFQFTNRDRVSVPTTSAFLIETLRIGWGAMLVAKMKPVQAASKSKAPALVAPISSWMMQAVAGKMYSGEEEVHMIRSISVGARFATCRAFMDASRPSVDGNSFSRAICRSRMPVRLRIHSSLVSTNLEISSLVNTGSGTLIPQPVMCAYGIRTPLFPETAQDQRGVV